MTGRPAAGDLRMIPIDRIDVLNARDRNEEVFAEIVKNIGSIGLKKPITVTPRPGSDGAERYLLVCGEGRMKALRKLGEVRVPALVIQIDDEGAFIMSLAENMARRVYRPLELLAGITQLKVKGYSASLISQKTGLTISYVTDILTLIDQGEERLLVAVERGKVPLTIAIEISRAGNSDKTIQAALQEAYETGQLRGRQLMDARRLVQSRQHLGRSVGRHPSPQPSDVTSSSLVRAYQKEVKRQQLMVRRAAFAQQRLLFVAGALRQLFFEENFVTLLRAEGLDALPKYLADRIGPHGSLG
ncbi:plasmid partitioning protein RepB C-terminal domain-containing protein [Variovorax paradoxus]|uniref:plasmid partitioning protein RepB C-terminal domain-containing protein n=1 Tax=Variovorax paradoxus TaxID=34073 RepID=UPI0024819349|nr:plasmid partitioning protein RepB C-terminal domain-containing protein [Variovorax paradoxus]WGT62472.1 plasmid partitioning protein RepB C-terminal domain-containing protein [Variovorax paradoxus]